MGFATVITWFATVLLGLFMLAVWLIENDVTGQGVAPSRLPVPVIFAHLGLAATGLTVWTAFLIFNQKTLAWTAVGILGAIALLGATMFARWIPVYRGPAQPQGPAQLPVTRSPSRQRATSRSRWSQFMGCSQSQRWSWPCLLFWAQAGARCSAWRASTQDHVPLASLTPVSSGTSRSPTGQLANQVSALSLAGYVALQAAGQGFESP